MDGPKLAAVVMSDCQVRALTQTWWSDPRGSCAINLCGLNIGPWYASSSLHQLEGSYMACMSTRLFCNDAIVPREMLEHVNKAAKLPIGWLYELSWRSLCLTCSQVSETLNPSWKLHVHGEKGSNGTTCFAWDVQDPSVLSNCNGRHRCDDITKTWKQLKAV